MSVHDFSDGLQFVRGERRELRGGDVFFQLFEATDADVDVLNEWRKDPAHWNG